MISLAALLLVAGAGIFLKTKGSATPSADMVRPSAPLDRALYVHTNARLSRLPAELFYDILEDLVADYVDFLVTHVDNTSGAPLTDLPGAPPVTLLWVSRALRVIATKAFSYALGAEPDATGSFASNPWLAVRPVRAAYLGLSPCPVPPGASTRPSLLLAYGSLKHARGAMSWYLRIAPLRAAPVVSPALYGPRVANQMTSIVYGVTTCEDLRERMRARVLRRVQKSVRFAAIVTRLWVVAMVCRDIHQQLLDLETGAPEDDAAVASLIAQIREATLEEDNYLTRVRVSPAAGDSAHRRSSNMLSKAIANSGIVPVLNAIRWCPRTPDTVTLKAHAVLERWAVLLPKLGIQSVLFGDRGRSASPLTKHLPRFQAKRELAACMFGQATWLLDRLHGYADDAASRNADDVYGQVVGGVISGAVEEIGLVLATAESFLSWKGERCMSDLAEKAIWKDLALLRDRR